MYSYAILSPNHVRVNTVSLDVAKQILDNSFVFEQLNPFSVEEQKLNFKIKKNLDLDTDEDIIKSYNHFMKFVDDLFQLILTQASTLPI